LATQNTANFSGGTPANLYTLSFKIQFKYDNDSVYFAYCYPYTYSDCAAHITRICAPVNKDRIRRAPLCKTLAGNDCDMLIITNFGSAPEQIA